MKNFKKIISIIMSIAIALCIVQGIAIADTKPAATGFDAIRNSLELVWNDEFNGNSLDKSKWRYETPYSTSYNQVYADSDDDGNVRVENGNLVIEARREQKTAYVITDSNNKQITTDDASSGGSAKTFEYTSGRLYSNIDGTDKNSFKYGMIEARLKATDAKNIFPAFWTTGFDHINNVYRTWPQTGEIDILESRLNGVYNTSTAAQGLHYQKDGAHASSMVAQTSVNGSLGDDYHIYGIYYTDTRLIFYVDDIVAGIKSISDTEYDFLRTYAQNIILNIAVIGTIDSSFESAQMLVDYVRVYQAPDDDYSHINILNAEYCNYSNASSATQSIYNNPTVVKVKDSSVIATGSEFEPGTYDIYASSLDNADSGDFSFEINGIPTNTSVGFSEAVSDTAGANQHYIGTVQLNEKDKLSVGFNCSDDSDANIDTLIIVGNSSNTPNVIVNTLAQNDPYSFETEELTINSIQGTSTVSSYTESAFVGKSFLVFDAAKANAILKDDYIEFILTNIKSGAYNLVTYNRMWANRSIFDISINGQVQQQNVDFAKTVSSATYEAINCGTVTFSETGDALLRFTVTSEDSKRNSGFYMDKMELVPVTDTKILTIDKTSQKVIAGTVYTLPNSTVKGFAFYTDGTNYYNAGDLITVDNDISLTTVSVGEISMQSGAAIRLNEKNGIRFYTNIDKEKIAELRADGYTVELGTLISPADILGTDELTFNLEDSKYIDVKYDCENYFTDSSGFSGVVGSIISIKESETAYSQISGNITRDFVGRGYIKVSKGDKVLAVIYASYADNDITKNIRSLKTVANALKNDTDENAQAIYANKKELIDKWADAVK